jgi:ribonuclease HII
MSAHRTRSGQVVAAADTRLPNLDAERPFWRAGLPLVAGVDEVGRGALAGPLLAAAVILPACSGPALRRLRLALAGVNDSKQLAPERRVALMQPICATAVAFAVGIVEPDELDAIGLGPANRLAMSRAVLALPVAPHALILDACTLDLELPQVGLIDADARSLSVAAASIVAKVTRDHLMVEADLLDPRYGFAQHKGYGSRLHQERLAFHGPGPLHRLCFAPVGRAAAAGTTP